MIEIQHVTKRYGDKLAVNDATFTIRKGEIMGFLGRNGAGKTTTMNIITGYISASRGTVLLDGYDILDNPREAKRRIGYLPEIPPLYPDMTVNEYLRFVCAIKDVKRSRIAAHLNEITELTGLGEVRRRLIRNLSKGYRQRVGMAQALVGNPEVVILDEPTVGLDPGQILEVRRMIRQLGEDHTVVLSSHILPEVADVCDRLVIIHQGRIVAEDSLEHLTRAGENGRKLRLRIAGPEAEVLQTLRETNGVQQADSLGSREKDSVDYLLQGENGKDIRAAVFHRMAERGYPILIQRPVDPDLEDIFLQLTGDSGEEA
ncbi:MAG: ABC transporter ATP-binding protein [Clostridia bacterium]|nr:ABC transporter ATP-binding protein [Clostridia bacterium]